MESIKISSSSLSGVIQAPPSKSHTLRGVLFASMARGKSKILNPLNSPDTHSMIEACRQLGARIERIEHGLEIWGNGGNPVQPTSIIDAGNSGQVLRFVTAMAALLPGQTIISGDESIQNRRPMQPLIDGINQLGGHGKCQGDHGMAPVSIQGPVNPGIVKVDGLVSQPISALLMLAALLKGESQIHVSNPQEKPWTTLTVDWLKRLSVQLESQNGTYYRVIGRAGWQGFEYTVPGDFSAALFPVVAALLTRSVVTVKGLNWEDAQGDKFVFDKLKAMGANLIYTKNGMEVLQSDDLRGAQIDVNDFADALPILSVLACFAKGETRLINADVARMKESDRLASIVHELSKMGAKICQKPSELIICGGKLRGAMLDSWQDHRIAMALSVAALASEGDTHVRRTACIGKSYPAFVQEMAVLGANMENQINDEKG